MAATGKVIGTVTAVVGEAKATAADGTIRILQVGDAVHSDEVITTSAAGSINVALESGKTLDCGGDVNLTLHESILGVATAAPPASDVDAIQRAISAGQDPSQVAAATAAGGAPAAGGADADGGAHEPVILEQSNTASIVTSGFTTEGETISFPAQQVSLLPVETVASVSPSVGLRAETGTSSIPAATGFDSVAVSQVSAVADDHATAPVTVSGPAQATPVAAVEIAPDQPVETSNAPQVVVSDTGSEEAPIVADAPAIPAADTHASEEVAQSPQEPIVVAQPNPEPAVTGEDAPLPADAPAIPAVDTEGDEQVAESPQSPVVVTQPEDETVVVTQPEDDSVAATVPEDASADLPDSTSASAGSLTYSISANTNQDEQLALLTFENGEHMFQSLVFFHQQGQQKPMAVPLEFDLDFGANSTIKLQYIDAFAGDSDASTGHTSQKIAIKDFALGQGDANTLIAQESDGVNIGLVGKTTQMEGTVVVKMNDPSTTADDASAGPVGDWSYANPTDVNDRVTYDGNPVNSPQADTNGGFDILDVTSSSLDLGDLADSELENFEVIALKGSGAQTLTLSVDDVLKVTDDADVLHIIGGKEEVRGNTVHDTLNVAGSGWTVVDGDSSAAGIQPSYFGWIQVTHSSGATLLVDPDVNVHLLG
ncbi:MAG: retention module-containing protein [Burkholderiales bacterium]|nr:retention module-containing protein [Burkholderiales bacterium]